MSKIRNLTSQEIAYFIIMWYNIAKCTEGHYGKNNDCHGGAWNLHTGPDNDRWEWKCCPAGAASLDNAQDGCNIVVVPVNSETGEQSGSASLCAHWDTERVASQLFELLGLPRNIPSLAHIWLAAKEDGLDLCDYCQQQGSLCDICAIAEAVRELEAESDDR